ncbi:unnamed protein product, partial [Ixodes pacificus]
DFSRRLVGLLQDNEGGGRFSVFAVRQPSDRDLGDSVVVLEQQLLQLSGKNPLTHAADHFVQTLDEVNPAVGVVTRHVTCARRRKLLRNYTHSHSLLYTDKAWQITTRSGRRNEKGGAADNG